MPDTVEGERAAAALAGALERVSGLVPYLTARIDPTEGDWMSGRALIDDPAWLGAVIRSTGPQIGTEDPVVAASVFVQGYSYRVLTLAVGCLTVSGVVPDASAGHMAIGLAGGWLSLVAYLDPRVLVVHGAGDATDGVTSLRTDPEVADAALRFVLDRAVDGHLGPLIGAVRSGLGAAIGERLLWGNVAASAATAFRTMEGCLGSWVVPLGEAFFTLAPAELQSLGSFCVVESDGRRGWFWERTNCCLIDRLPGGVRCADCSRTPSGQRRQDYERSLHRS
jgi:iron complex transport system ATP-binding protein